MHIKANCASGNIESSRKCPKTISISLCFIHLQIKHNKIALIWVQNKWLLMRMTRRAIRKISSFAIVGDSSTPAIAYVPTLLAHFGSAESQPENISVGHRQNDKTTEVTRVARTFFRLESPHERNGTNDERSRENNARFPIMNGACAARYLRAATRRATE